MIALSKLYKRVSEGKLVKKRIIGLIALIFIIIGLTGCFPKQGTRYEASFFTLFDTVTTIIAYTDNEETFTEQSQYICDRLKKYHELFDIYNDYQGINNIKTINDQAGIAPVKVEPEIIDFLEFSKEMYEKTEGEVNIAFGSVLSIWHDYREEGIADPKNARIPPMEILQEKAKHTDINKIMIDKENSTVFLEDPEMKLDVGAIAKGYAVERVSQDAMKNKDFTRGLINVGGNVRSIGYKDDKKELWGVGIQNPDIKNSDQTVETLYITDASLVTSGVYQRFYTVLEKDYHHIIDPTTLMPADHFSSVTIITTDSGVADALSTGIFNMPFEEGKAFIEKDQEAEAYWIFKDGSSYYSSGFEKYLKK